MLQRLLLITITLCSLSASAQWQQTGSKVRYVNGLGIPTKDTAAGVSADSSQIVIRPADSSLYVKYKRTWIRVGGGGGSIGGSGTTNYVPKFTASGFIGNSSIVDSASAVAMTITPSGKVGINTLTPVATLDVNGSFRIPGIGSNVNPASAGTNPNYFRFLSSGADFYIGTEGSTAGGFFTGSLAYDNVIYGNSTAINLINGGVSRLYVNSSGNIGIGYTAPAAKLAVSGTTLINTNTDNGVDRLQVNGGVTASGTLTAATIVKSGGTSSQFLMADGSTSLGGGGTFSGTTNYVPKFTSSSAIGNSQIIDDGNNLCLRTTTSTYPVNINLGANSGIGFYQDGTSSSIIGTNQDLSSTNFLSIKGAGIEVSGSGSTNVSLMTNSNNRLQVLSSGRVLLGATLPTDNTVDALQVNGSISGIGMKQAYVTKTGAYTATNADYVIDCTSGTFTVTLPASSGRTGRILIIKNSGAGTITVDGNSSETIDGAATVTLSVQYATIQIMSDGTNWKTIAKF
jgi:hypothetical protein